VILIIPDLLDWKKYRNMFRPLIFVALLFLSITGNSQNSSKKDSDIRIPSGSLIHIGNNISFYLINSHLAVTKNLVPSSVNIRDKNIDFYDSLKLKASRNNITKKLYSFIIISNNTGDFKHITGTSEASYISYSGKKIRNINLKRLDVFGTNIDNPVPVDHTKVENILNRTHVNTNERIIRKNLLFSEGDIISPLVLSDNERILRQLPYIVDARIIVVPVSDEEADILVITKDVYSLGASYSYQGLKSGAVSVFEKNIFGIGHELGFEIPFDSKYQDSPGFGIHYSVNNLLKSFININTYFLKGLGEKTYGFSLNRKLVSSSTKYAYGISVQQMYKTEDLNNTLTTPQPLKYNMQDYFLSRSFLINPESVTRIIIGARFTNNNIFERPVTPPEYYPHLDSYKRYLGSLAFSKQKYYKTNLIYGYGRTEDIPYGMLLRVTAGREDNEFKERTYLGTEVAFGKSSKKLGYFYSSAGLGSYFKQSKTEQGILSLKMNYFSNLVTLGRNMIRNFVYVDYTRGFDRYAKEFITFQTENGFSGFRNDSVRGNQRFSLSIESVLFSPLNVYGFRFAFFGFADFSFLSGTNQILENGNGLSSIGLGVRIRNDNLVFKTFQLRFGYFPVYPDYSKITRLNISGEQLLSPDNFDSGPPLIIPYR